MCTCSTPFRSWPSDNGRRVKPSSRIATRRDDGSGLKGWSNGDFNYDGKINIDDYVIIDGNIGNQGPPFSNVTSIGDTATSVSAWVGQPAIAWSGGEQRRDKWADLLPSAGDATL
jgi:hypothetical protein